jgi:hypothetical protein
VAEVVHGVLSLFDAAWRAATDFAVFDRDAVELHQLGPHILEHLNTGTTDEAVARVLGLGVRTYLVGRLSASDTAGGRPDD